jgi:hypothetical protein
MSHYASMMQGQALALLQAGFGSRFKTYRSTPAMQVKPTDLPMLGVYIIREKRTPMGKANHAEPKFKHELTLGFSGAVHAETDNQNKLDDLEETMSEVDDILFCNPLFVKLVEGFTGMDRQSQYAKVGETTLFEIRVELQCEFSGWFDPIVIDDFNTLHVELQYPPNVDPATVLQIIRVYEINQNLTKSKAGLNGGHAPRSPLT